MNLKSPRSIAIIILILILLAGGAFLFVIMNRPEKKTEGTSAKNETQTQGSNQAQNAATTSLVYTHPELGFSFTYPAGTRVGIVEEGEDGEMVLVQKVGQVGTLGQVYISPFPEGQVLTAELIAKEFPGKKIANGKKVLIGGAEAFSFESSEEGIGDTWEVVFAQDGKIYQAMSVLNNRTEFEAILSSWEF